MLWELGEKLLSKDLHLLIGDGEELFHCVQQSFKDQRQRLCEADLRSFGSHEPEQFPECAIIRSGPLVNSENHVPDTNNGQVTGEGVKGRTVGLLQELEMLLAGFEIHLNVPSDPIAANNLLLRSFVPIFLLLFSLKAVSSIFFVI